jgi:hypothetical protein
MGRIKNHVDWVGLGYYCSSMQMCEGKRTIASFKRKEESKEQATIDLKYNEIHLFNFFCVYKTP